MDWSYWADKPLQILFVLTQNIITHFLLFKIQFMVMGIRLSTHKLVLGSAIISVLYVLPQYLIDFLFSGQHFYTTLRVCAIFMVVNPLTAVLYYFVVKKFMGFSPTRTTIVWSNLLVMHYIVVLLFWLMNNALMLVMRPLAVWPFFYAHEIVSIILMIFLLLLVYFVAERYVAKTKHFIIIPPQYIDKNVRVKFVQTIAVMTAFYAAIVFFRAQWLTGDALPADMTPNCIYILLAVNIATYLALTISQLKVRVQDWEMQATGAYISSLLHANQEFRKVKHDFYNVLQTYGGYLAMKDYAALEKYHQTLFHTTKIAGDILALIDVLKNRIPIYSLLEAKIALAERLGVMFSVNLVCDITDVTLSDFDLCRVLSIVLDNAIEAANLSAQKQVDLSFVRKNKETVVLAIANTTEGDVALDKIFVDGYTTKDGHSGIGLSQVMEILRSHEHCTTRVSYHDNLFTLFLIFSARQEDA